MKKTIFLLFILAISTAINAQIKRYASMADSMYYASSQYRLVGPFRGGRAATACGSLVDKNVFYMGTTGGGVWHTRDAGENWDNISDKYFGGSIGSIALAPTDENIIYVGEGENTMRGNVSEGIGGMWKTINGGRTWQNIGLNFGRHITKIIVHPKNENIVWAAVMGPLFGTSSDRGIYKTTDGGKNWQKILGTPNVNTGGIEITMEPNNPDVLYASLWQMQRTPYSMESGGKGSGVYKSIDGGATWVNITQNKGLPKDSIYGISYVAIAPSNPDKVYLLLEAKEGGLFVSNDAGTTWKLQSQDANIRQRAWYFSKMAVDPFDENTLFICNVEFWKSTDGGKTIKSVATPHADHHNIWIDPKDNKRMIVCDDGGAQVSKDGSNTWSTYYNQPTSQIYRISADNAYPYNLLGGQQDNSSVRIKSRTKWAGIYNSDFSSTAGGEAGVDVADPLNPDIVYGGEYMGILRRYDHKTGEVRHINIWPESNIGSGAENLKYRFQWNFPLFFSMHKPNRLYAGGNHLFYTEDEGVTWQCISPDLTTNNKNYQQASGGPITKDNTTVEYYCTVFAAAECVQDANILYTGSDDGLIHITKDGGKNWTNITPPNIPSLMLWNSIEADPFAKGTLYAIGTRYKQNDFKPYIYKSTNFGATWQLITKGIPNNHFTRCLRADKKREGLLYAGTEYGMYISYDGGQNWKTFQHNLPIVPITDMCIKYNDLCVATQGRAIWVLDDLAMVQAYQEPNNTKQALKIFPINESIIFDAWGGYEKNNAGKNPPNGTVVRYFIPNGTDTTKATIKILNAQKEVIQTYSTQSTEKEKIVINGEYNTFVWNQAYPSEPEISGMVFWNGSIYNGPKAPPGLYYAKIIAGKDSVEKEFNILPNPTYKASIADYQEQFMFLMQVKATFDTVQNSIKKLRSIRNQISAFKNAQKDTLPKNITTLMDSINIKLDKIENNLYQTKAKSGQDVLNYPIKINDKIASLYNQGNDGYCKPTKASKEVHELLKNQAFIELANLKSVLDGPVVQLNNLIKQSNLNIIGAK
jgi:photosystem II stability/assembly factor-like uncharacterized protein